ncbi:hypothetical protein [Pseudokineococcus sp. 1T1Z-3]|uniref:hypothetical protein n=1 Tax=Pseudokineococcus sp. 1T1Z-3 TaxID=3132745 RepID=UPI00309B83F2
MPDQTRSPRPSSTRSSTPDVLPVLSRGRHRSPRHGACFMEMASFLAGERWSDHPRCTHPLLARLAREVNDRTSDDARPRLGLLVPAVVGLTDEDPATDARLALTCARRALPVAPEDQQRALAVSLLVGEEMLADLEGRPEGSLSAATAAALQDVPLAAAWARQFLARTGHERRSSRGRSALLRDYRRHGATSAVSTAVRGISLAARADVDAELHDLLAEAVALVAAAPTSTTPVAEQAWAAGWDDACRLSAAGRR